VRVGDLLLAINSRPLNHVQDLVAILQASKIGTKLDIIVARDGRRLHLRVTLGKRPAVQSRAPLLGLRTVRVTPELREQYKLPSSSGAFVQKVTRDSPADEAGIPAHVLVAKINGRTVSSPEDLRRWVEAAGTGGFVELIYYDQGRLRKKSLKLAETGTAAGIVVKRAKPRVAPSPRPERPAAPSLPSSDRQRIRLLEQRIQDLEKRIGELEENRPDF
ncbi:MAG: PDZ domain-containing protein, partial [Pirellulales bacterium]|nr:PDZ domain-containing protein [Pirellulales bacterium]